MSFGERVPTMPGLGRHDLGGGGSSTGCGGASLRVSKLGSEYGPALIPMGGPVPVLSGNIWDILQDE